MTPAPVDNTAAHAQGLADEEVPAALARELREELGLDLAELPGIPELRWPRA
ncbi:hypothetical protein [Streptomyces roseifaciens]|uniref:hypothetical protein n=1 Tax=Streptomyces roseifaciens TaxID=1488406 RepID=UPI000A5628A0|nr:hypothetical protein [Streptomyces roseifaciens]